jgi:hypothetical protein
LLPGAASSRLEIPGYSFRSYRIEHDEKTVALFAPAKVHFSAEVRNATELYFRVAPGEHAVLAGKFHGGVSGLQAQRVGDEQTLTLALKPYRAGQPTGTSLAPASARHWQSGILARRHSQSVCTKSAAVAALARRSGANAFDPAR